LSGWVATGKKYRAYDQSRGHGIYIEDVKLNGGADKAGKGNL
jgi:hypothetical protein